MGSSRHHHIALALVIVAALLIAASAVLLTTQGDPLNGLFRHVLTVPVIAVLVGSNLIAWAARRMALGKLPKIHLKSTAALIWGGCRFAMLVATVTLLLCWLVRWSLDSLHKRPC